MIETVLYFQLLAEVDISQLCISVLRHMSQEEADGIARGQVSDWADFKRRRGRHSALEDAEEQIRDALRKRFDPNHEDEEE